MGSSRGSWAGKTWMKAGRWLFPWVLGALAGASGATAAEKKKSEASVEGTLSKRPELVNASELVPDLLVELKYATPDNFMGASVYGDLKSCYLNRDAARMLARARELLRARAAGLRLLVYDCTRPCSVQRIMWKKVEGTSRQGFVADPRTALGSVHNYGCAVDLTLADAGGKPLAMGTPFDHFGREAQPRSEFQLLEAGKLTHEQVGNRLLLRQVMIAAGFYPLPHEWWHFDCVLSAEVRRRYRQVE